MGAFRSRAVRVARLTFLWVLGGATFLFMAVVAALQWPSSVFRPETLRWAAWLAEKGGIHLTWQELRAEGESLSFFRKRLRIELSGPCFAVPREGVQGCFEAAAADVVVNLAYFPPRLTRVERGLAAGGKLWVELREGKEEKARRARGPELPDPEGLKELLPKWLRRAEYREVLAELRSWEVRLGSGRAVSGRLRLSRSQGPWKADFEVLGDFSRRAGPELSVRGALEQARDRDWAFLYQLEGGPSDPRFSARARGVWAPGELTATLEGRFAPLGAPRRRTEIRAQGCQLKLVRGEPGASGPERRARRLVSSARLTLKCPLELKLGADVLRWRDVPRFQPPRTLSVRVLADLATDYFPGPESPFSGEVRLGLEPWAIPSAELAGELVAHVVGVPAEPPSAWGVEGTVMANAKIPEFQRAVEMLRGTPWAVPAPVNVMRGEVRVAAEGRIDPREGLLPLRIRTRLESRSQRLDVDGEGELRLGKISELDLRLLLTDVQLALPRLDLGAPPRLLPDSRIQAKDSKARAGALAFRYRIEVVTPSDRPVRLISNLAKAPVPVSIQVVLEDRRPPIGYVRLGEFPLQVFRRDARMERLEVELNPDPAREDEPPALDGRIQVKYTDYTIDVLLLGNAREPVVKLRSDPPLPEDQLVAALVFGRPVEELAEEESESVGNFRAALADRAINLASLYVLASTPVESVGYDPSSGVVSAKVRLGEGTSLNVGTGGRGVEEVGIRKRLGGNWTITTDVSRSAEGSGSEVSAFLEWSRRY